MCPVFGSARVFPNTNLPSHVRASLINIKSVDAKAPGAHPYTRAKVVGDWYGNG